MRLREAPKIIGHRIETIFGKTVRKTFWFIPGTREYHPTLDVNVPGFAETRHRIGQPVCAAATRAQDLIMFFFSDQRTKRLPQVYLGALYDLVGAQK